MAYGEPVVVIVRYDDVLVYIIDPTFNFYSERRIDDFMRTWEVLGNMSIVYQEPA